MSNKNQIILALIVLLLGGCQPAPTSTIEMPTAQTLRINVTPATTWMQPAINQCQQETIGLNLRINEIATRRLDPSESDLLIISGEPDITNSFAVDIATTTVAIIVNSANPVQDIPMETLRKIFGGQISDWSDVEASLPAENIRVWIPPSSDDTWGALKSVLVGGKSISRSANIAPDGNAMLASISADQYAIGILPRPFLSSTVKALNVEPELPLPIIAVTQSEPQGLLREFLLCLQAYQLP